MAVKLTKNELKNQKDQLKQFQRYLPTLQLKKQQLQTVIRNEYIKLEKREEEIKQLVQNLNSWIAVFSENKSFEEDKRLEKLVIPSSVIRKTENIAGVIVPIFDNLTFEDVKYNVEDYPLWVDTAVVKLREIAALDALIRVQKIRVECLEKELRTTSQRVNLFEKVKIPQTIENIRRIGIYLGDQMTFAVVRGKIAKKKLKGEAV